MVSEQHFPFFSLKNEFVGFSIWLISEHYTVIVAFFQNEFEFNIFRRATPYVRQNEIGKRLKWISRQVSNDFWLSTHFSQIPVVAN